MFLALFLGQWSVLGLSFWDSTVRVWSTISYSRSLSHLQPLERGFIYIGISEHSFKTKYNNYKLSFQHRKHLHDTSPYKGKPSRCNLNLTETLFILSVDKSTVLNNRSELVTKYSTQQFEYSKSLLKLNLLCNMLILLFVLSFIVFNTCRARYDMKGE